MTLKYDDVPGSWGTQSQGWPETPFSIGKWLLCTQARVVPHGSYVRIDKGWRDAPESVIRVETPALLKKLEDAYHGMFVRCRHLLKGEFE